MYAKLCHQLCREAPNFEPESSNISTFRRLLLNKCQDEFENRSKTFDSFDTENGLSEEEMEQRHIAKHKMLGNIKFIGELGKLEMLHEGILHRCIKQLLDKKKNIPLCEMAEDLECLCQIMTTVGQRLDSPKAKAWMDKYFSRIKVFAGTDELPSRIRFMLQDVIDLRDNKWVSRREGWDLGPKTITQIRQEAADESGVFIPQQGRLGGPRPPMNGGFGFKLPPTSGAFGDFFGMPQAGMMAGSTLGTGPGVIQVDGYVPNYTPKQRNSPQTQGYNNYQKRPDGGSPRTQRHNFQGQQQGGRLSPQSQQNQQQQQQQSFQQQKNKTTLPPRLARLQQQQQQQQHQQTMSPQQAIMMQVDGQMPIPMPNTSVPPPTLKQEEINLRPNRNFTTALRPSVPTMLPKSAQAAPSTGPPMMSGSQFLSEQRANNLNPLLAKQAAVTIKQVPQEKLNHVKKKSEPSKDEVQKASKTMLEEYLIGGDLNEAIAMLKELNAPLKFLPEVISDMMISTIDKTDEKRENVMKLIVAMKMENLIKSTTFMDGFKLVLEQMSELETDVPLVKSYVARYAAEAVAENIITLLDLSEPMEQGTFYPLFLICLQQMLKLRDNKWLVNIFNESKMDLQMMLPEVDRSKERMMEILEERGLSFMFPLLRVQSELWRQIQVDPSATAIFKWIKEKVSEDLHHTSGFINILTTSLLRHVTSESTLNNETVTSNPDKTAIEKEKQALDKLKGVLQLLVNDRTNLQMHCLYAAQVFCHTNQFPKGMLLRLFMDFYDMEIVEEEVFFKWKEEVNDEYPGKGKALFQVNQWLTWLEEAEEESDDED